MRKSIFVCLALAVLTGSAAAADGGFPVSRDLMLDAPPMRPAKRMPALRVETNGAAVIDLWCKSVPGQVEVSGEAIRIVPGPLPEALPAMMSRDQCTPARLQADERMLAALSQMTSWRRSGDRLVLSGAETLRFMLLTN